MIPIEKVYLFETKINDPFIFDLTDGIEITMSSDKVISQLNIDTVDFEFTSVVHSGLEKIKKKGGQDNRALSSVGKSEYEYVLEFNSPLIDDTITDSIAGREWSALVMTNEGDYYLCLARLIMEDLAIDNQRIQRVTLSSGNSSSELYLVESYDIGNVDKIVADFGLCQFVTPTNLMAIPQGQKQIDLEWDEQQGATFGIERKYVGEDDTAFVQIITTSNNTYTDTFSDLDSDKISNTRFKYRVRVVSPSVTDYSGVVQARTYGIQLILDGINDFFNARSSTNFYARGMRFDAVLSGMISSDPFFPRPILSSSIFTVTNFQSGIYMTSRRVASYSLGDGFTYDVRSGIVPNNGSLTDEARIKVNHDPTLYPALTGIDYDIDGDTTEQNVSNGDSQIANHPILGYNGITYHAMVCKYIRNNCHENSTDAIKGIRSEFTFDANDGVIGNVPNLGLSANDGLPTGCTMAEYVPTDSPITGLALRELFKDANNIHVSADEPDGSLQYTYQISTSSDFSSGVTTVSNVKNSAWIFSGLTTATTYYIRFRKSRGIEATENMPVAWSSTLTITTP